MDHNFLSALVLLLLVLDPLGSLPIFIAVLRGVAPERRRRVALRETLIAFTVLLASRQPGRVMEWVAALTVAMTVCGVVLLAADRIRKLLGSSMVSAIEKLMGLVLTAIAVEMILAGLKRYFMEGPLS
jgi:small neutral amino acid transporter SnatA (MarC family)